MSPEDAEIRKKFAELVQASAQVNAESDELRDTVQKFESKLRALKLGLEVSVPCGEGGVEIRLGYQKTDAGWGLTVGSLMEDTRPILAAKRNQRLTAILYIPDLLNALLAEARSTTAVLEQTNAVLDKVMEGLR